MTTGLAVLRILVVDDNPQMRTIVGTVLSAAGVGQVYHAADGRQGLLALTSYEPDICFVDYEMPVMNGLDFISNVRSMHGPLRMIPLIMLTGHSDELRLRAARDRGVTEFLAKPVAARTILSRLEVVILRPRPFVSCTTYYGPDRRRRAAVHYAGPFRRSADTAKFKNSGAAPLEI